MNYKQKYFSPLFFSTKKTLSSLFSLAQKNFFFTLFFGAKKRDKRNIHLLQTSPYMGRLNRSSRRSYTKVSSPHQRGGLYYFSAGALSFDL